MFVPPRPGASTHVGIGTGPCIRCRARRHWRLDRDFNQFAPPLIAEGQLAAGTIEGCPYAIVSQRDLLRHVFAALIDNPRATLSAKAQHLPAGAA